MKSTLAIIFCIISVCVVWSLFFPPGLVNQGHFKTHIRIKEIELLYQNYFDKNGVYPVKYNPLKLAQDYDKEFDTSYISGNNFLDEWNKPFVIVASKEYEKNQNAIKNHTGIYFKKDSFQIRSFGKNGVDDKSKRDDICNFK
jgi:hypothetical protein